MFYPCFTGLLFFYFQNLKERGVATPEPPLWIHIRLAEYFEMLFQCTNFIKKSPNIYHTVTKL